jgi:hypothetical protein
MGYYDHDTPEPEPESAGVWGAVNQTVALLTRLLGVGVLVVGLWTAVSVILEAWGLYREPARIERFADAIERGSNLDRLFAPRAGAAPAEAPAIPAPPATPAEDSLRLSYFIAWIVVLLLLFVIGSLGMAAISTGGQLALYDLQVRRFSRQVVREIRRANR